MERRLSSAVSRLPSRTHRVSGTGEKERRGLFNEVRHHGAPLERGVLTWTQRRTRARHRRVIAGFTWNVDAVTRRFFKETRAGRRVSREPGSRSRGRSPETSAAVLCLLVRSRLTRKRFPEPIRSVSDPMRDENCDVPRNFALFTKCV